MKNNNVAAVLLVPSDPQILQSLIAIQSPAVQHLSVMIQLCHGHSALPWPWAWAQAAQNDGQIWSVCSWCPHVLMMTAGESDLLLPLAEA
mmetsp:Transcript_12930/g.22807  ORF Transcript_12930/g.22807 Transcript_12930/m.22807 type:complete len:90 (-) Transcript_12930:88-357(-)